MPTEVRPMRPEDGYPVSHTNSAAGIIMLVDSPGINMSHFITGFVLTGGGTSDGFSFLRRNALTFTAADNTLTISDDAYLEPTESDFAVVFGIKTSDHTLVSMISKKTGSPINGINIEVLASGKLKVTFGDGTATASITSDNKVNDNQWHQVIINWEYQEAGGEGLNLYIDGELAATAVSNKSVSSVTGGSADLIISGSDSKTFKISTLALYKGQYLSSAEITALWADGAGHKFTGLETGLSGAWNIDEGGTATDHQDLSAYNNDGTSANTVWDDSGEGFPIDPHALKETIKYNTGVLTSSGVIPTNVVNLPHAIKIGRNNPIFIEETDGGFGLELYGFIGPY